MAHPAGAIYRTVMSSNPPLAPEAFPLGDAAAKKPARRRRKDARPGEIIEAATEVFCEQGFGAAKLEEVARRAGVAKGTVFLYFPTKQDLFRAVARSLVEAHLARLDQAAPAPELSFPELLSRIMALAAQIGDTRAVSIARLMIAESRTFPDLARLWYDEVVSKVLGLVVAAISRAQARGEIRPGDPQLYAMSIIGPMMMGLLFRDVFGAAGAPMPDLRALADQHSEVIMRGMKRQDALDADPS